MDIYNQRQKDLKIKADTDFIRTLKKKKKKKDWRKTKQRNQKTKQKSDSKHLFFFHRIDLHGHTDNFLAETISVRQNEMSP